MSGKTKAELELENGKYRAKLEGLYDNLGDFLGVDEEEEEDDEENDDELDEEYE